MILEKIMWSLCIKSREYLFKKNFFKDCTLQMFYFSFKLKKKGIILIYFSVDTLITTKCENVPLRHTKRIFFLKKIKLNTQIVMKDFI